MFITMVAGTYRDGHHIVGTVYRVVRHIGTGGMGSLYEVEDTTVGRHYVLKTLHPELIDRADLAARMQDEARALGRLSHPNIVEVITAGVTGDTHKMPFYVMERLVGQNLRSVIDARRAMAGGVGAANAYRICIDVLSALQHAHENAMVHRDVKPENIFLHRAANGTTVTKLLDFGIVRLLNRQASVTRGKFLGTLRYSSPEQITGGREIGPASDVYSLALVLYEMLVGRGPFDDEKDAFKVGAAHAGTAPPPPSRFFHVAPDVERLLLQALEKQPESRPASAGAFADSLRRAMKELEATPSMATDVELLSAHHPIQPIQSGAPVTVATGTATITSPGSPGSLLPPTPMPATRVERAGMAAVADTVPVHPSLPQAPGPVHAANQPHHAPNQGPALDRSAPTRIRPASEPNVIVATNDTAVAVSRHPTLRMPDAPGAVALPVRPPEALAATHKRPQRDLSTVPMRPRKGNHAVLAIFAAALVALAMIAGAAVVVLGRHAK